MFFNINYEKAVCMLQNKTYNYNIKLLQKFSNGGLCDVCIAYALRTRIFKIVILTKLQN